MYALSFLFCFDEKVELLASKKLLRPEIVFWRATKLKRRKAFTPFFSNIKFWQAKTASADIGKPNAMNNPIRNFRNFMEKLIWFRWRAGHTLVLRELLSHDESANWNSSSKRMNHISKEIKHEFVLKSKIFRATFSCLLKFCQYTAETNKTTKSSIQNLIYTQNVLRTRSLRKNIVMLQLLIYDLKFEIRYFFN